MLNPSSGFEENDHKDYLMEMHNRTINNKINVMKFFALHKVLTKTMMPIPFQRVWQSLDKSLPATSLKPRV